jgi:hypothetical protein
MTGFQTFINFHQLSESNAVLTNFQTFKTPVYLYTGSKVKVSTPPRKHGKSISNFQGERPHARPARNCAHAERAKNGPRSAPRRNRPIIRAARACVPRVICAPRPCALEATPDPPLGSSGRLAPAPIGRNPGNYSTHAFLADFGRETSPKATRHPARRTWARPGPRTSRFPLRLRPWEPTGSRPGARTAPADLRALQFSIACADRADRARPDRSTFAADGRGRRGERPLQHDISRA